MVKPEKIQVAVIGGGPGGLIACLYLLRFRRNIILFDNGDSRAAKIPKTNNLFGFPDGISGTAFLQILKKQVRALGLKEVKAKVTVHSKRNYFEVKSNSKTFLAEKIILATGIEDLNPPFKKVLQLRKLGLLRYCAICDGYEYRNKDIAVLLDDHRAFSKAGFLLHYAKQLKIFTTRPVKISSALRSEMKNLSAVQFFETEVKDLRASSQNEIEIELKDGRKEYARVAYIELGCRVKDEAFRALTIRRDPNGRVITDKNQETSIKGIFAVGDCTQQISQIHIAAGQATIAATTIHNQLRSHFFKLP